MRCGSLSRNATMRRSVMDDEATALRRDLLTGCRILASEGLVEAFGHLSARLPDRGGFVISARKSLSLVDEIDLVTVDLDGRVLAGTAMPPLETPLHTAIYRRRSDVGAVARTHSETTSVFSILGRPVRPVHDLGAILLGPTAIFSRSDLISSAALGTAAAEALGAATAILLRGNGTAVVGRDVAEACIRAIYLEESARLSWKAMQAGSPTHFDEGEVLARGTELLEDQHVRRAWEHYRRKAGIS